MNQAIKLCLLAAAVTAICCVGSNTAEAGNGWGWAKPLNQKPGSLFYTTNRRFKSNTKSRSSTYSYRPRIVRPAYKAPVYKAPVYQAPTHQPMIVHPPAVIQTAPPTTLTPAPSVPAGRLIQPSPAAAAPANSVPNGLQSWLVP